MTLRDCSVYVRFPAKEKDDEKMVEARLGDLDVKSAEKGGAWKRQERELIEGGWYTGSEVEKRREITCALGRKFRTCDRI
jgi:inositol-pentakisphosphate 2-kinase